MKEEKRGNSSVHSTGSRWNSTPNYRDKNHSVSRTRVDSYGRRKQSLSNLQVPSSRSRGYSRSQSTDNYLNDFSSGERLRELEDRRRYITSILEHHYYSNPPNFPISAPRGNIRDDLNIRGDNYQIRRMESVGAPAVAAEDSTSEVSSAVSCNRSDVIGRGGSNRATPDSSPYYDEEKDGAAFRSRTRNECCKKKSRFFRSASMRSIKRWMSKLRGRGKTNSNSEKKTNREPGTVSPPTNDAVLTNGSIEPAAAHDSCGAGASCSATKFDSSEQSDSVAAGAIIPNTNVNRGARGKNFSTNMPSSTVDIPTPALCGIVNHGNTCYINAVVQCLSNTDVLAEYFLSGQYWTDLRNNLRNADRYGSQGNVTLALARFFNTLWFNTYTSDVSSNFKSIMERYSEQYRGNQQQDAQEFFYWLADRVHEDLNVAVKRRYKLHKSRSKNEDELAAAAMEKHLEAHNSFISSRFHGLFLSTVVCPVCRKQSMKPDPFMCISLPVSQCTKRPLFVVVIFINRQPRQVRFGLNADVTATFLEVKKCLADATDLSVDQLLLCEMNDMGLQTTLSDHSEVMSLGRTKCIWAFEVPVSLRLPVTNMDDELILLVGNQLSTNGGGKSRFGSPVVLRINREVTYVDLCRALVHAMRPQLKPHVAFQEVPTNAFRIRIVDDFHPFAYIPNDVSLPLFTQAVDNALLHMTSAGLPPLLLHLKLMLEWQKEAKDRYFSQTEERIVDHVSSQDLRDQEEHPEVQSIHDCLAEYTRPEACQWYCPDCRHRQDSAAKRLVFYWLPDVLVLHLKRFKQLSSGQLVKLDATVWFPVSDLDLSDYTHQSISRNQRKQQRTAAQSYRTKNGELYIDTRPSQNLYDLYAVCNHSGHSPHSGHYTAFCRNPVNGRWYCFDDQSVTPIQERDLVTNGAYLLFYERRQLRKGSEGRNSAESGFVDHWYFRVYSNNQTDDQQKTAHKSKDSYDRNGWSMDDQKRPFSSSTSGHQLPQLDSVPESLASQSSRNGACGVASQSCGDANGTSANSEYNNRKQKQQQEDPAQRYEWRKKEEENRNTEIVENGQVIPVDVPDFASVLPVELTPVVSCAGGTSTSTRFSQWTMSKDNVNGEQSESTGTNRAVINGPSTSLGDRVGSSDVQEAKITVMLQQPSSNNRIPLVTDKERKKKPAAVQNGITDGGNDHMAPRLDSVAEQFQTCSVVETDL